jgi:hypothetical protein
MTEILILFLLYSDIFLMHWLHCSVFTDVMFLDVLIISVRAFIDFGHDATRNVIGVRTTSLRPCSVLTLRCPTQLISNLLHLMNLLFHVHIIIPIWVPGLFLDPIAWNLPIYSSLPCGLIPVVPSLASSSFCLSPLPWFYFQNLKGKLGIIREILPLTQIHPKFDPISIRNLSLNSMK